MGKITKALSIFLSLSFSTNSWAKLTDSTLNRGQSGNTDYSSASNPSDCLRLIDLENKEVISSEEYEEGVLLLQLLGQISDSPLEYCEVVAMGQVWEDLGTGELIGN